MMVHISVVAGRRGVYIFMEKVKEGKKTHHQQESKMRPLEMVVK